MRTLWALLCCCAALAVVTQALDNGLDDICGLLDWCNADEVKSIADAFVSEGLKDAGYKYILLDDCWAGPRDGNGALTADKDRFPDGLEPVIDYVHSKGLLFGLYTCAGNYTCKYKRPGSWGHFDQDAQTFADWKVDYVKMDWCYHPSMSPEIVYGMFRDSLNRTGRPMWFSLCEWGEDDPWLWGMQTGNSWRVWKDHLPTWWGAQGTANIITKMVGLSKYSGATPSGGGFWALWAAPLIVATDVRNMSDEKRSILLNSEVIAVNQDPLAVPGDLVANTSNAQVWSKPLHDHSQAVVLFNGDDFVRRNVSVAWSQLGWPDAQPVHVRDLWSHRDVGVLRGGYWTTLEPREVAMLRLTPQ